MRAVLIILYCLLCSNVFGQLYYGKSIRDSQDSLNLMVNKDSSVILMSYINKYFKFEYFGKIIKANDTLYRIQTERVFTHGEEKGEYGELEINMDSASVKSNTVTLTYQDGYKETLALSNTSGKKKSISNGVDFYVTFKINLKHVHYKKIKGIDGPEEVLATPIYFDIGHVNPVTGQAFVFEGEDEQAFYFNTIKVKKNFHLVINKDKMKLSIRDSSLISGTYLLTKATKK